jgi:chaperonin cofactor prefoldin
MTLNFIPLDDITVASSTDARIYELERQNADLRRQVGELRAAVEALLAPPVDVNIR